MPSAPVLAAITPPWVRDDLWRKVQKLPLADFRFDNGSIVDVISGATPTFTRPTTGKTFIDGAGILQTAGADVPTYAFDQATGQRLGIRLNCIAATNEITNNSMVGAGAGAPGTLPAGWLFLANSGNGLTPQIVGTGTEDGIAYMDVRFSGTTTSTAVCTVHPNRTAAVTGQTWTASVYWKLVGGSWANMSTKVITLIEETGAGGFITGANYDQANFPTAARLSSQRVQATRTFSGGGTVANARMAIGFNPSGSGLAVDFTVRIGLPQLETGPVATPPTITTGTALTRNADLLELTGAEFGKIDWDGGECVIYTEFQYAATNGTNQFLLSATSSDGAIGASSDEIRQLLGSSSLLTSATTINNTTIGTLFPAVTTGVFNRSAWRITPSGAQSINGSAVVTTTFATALDNIEKIDIGRRQGGSFPAADLILRRLAIFPANITDAQLQFLATP
jgi:hypothetical protein